MAYFKSLFASRENSDMQQLLYKVQCKVTNQMNLVLKNIYTCDEVEIALKKFTLQKLQDLTVCLLIFYKKFWHVICKYVIFYVLDILNNELLYIKLITLMLC